MLDYGSCSCWYGSCLVEMVVVNGSKLLMVVVYVCFMVFVNGSCYL